MGDPAATSDEGATPAPPSRGGPVSSDDPKPRPDAKALVIPPPHESVFRYANKRKAPVNKNAWWRLLLRVLFSHVGLFVLVCAYAIGGAYMFVAIEKPAERQRKQETHLKALEANDTMQYLATLFWFFQAQNLTAPAWNDKIYKELKAFELYTIKLVNDNEYDGTLTGRAPDMRISAGVTSKPDEDDYDDDDLPEDTIYAWNIPNTILFTVSVMSTIGYGHICPKTRLGQIVCVLYAIGGIPLLLLFLANIGDVMARAFTYSYSRFCCHWCRMRRKKSEYRRGDDYLPVPKEVLRTVATEKVGPEAYMPTDTIMVPIMLNLILISVYIVTGAVLFSYWEKWTMVEAGYFTFITLSTVGLGDYVPGKSFNSGDDDGDSDLNKKLRMLATCLYCALGMATVSMCIALMQEQIVYKMRRMGEDIGLLKPTLPQT